jgi:small subunit ribosomal protein S19
MHLLEERLVQLHQREQERRNKMAKKEFTYRGKTMEELKAMPIQDFMKLVPARKRRTLSRGFTDAQKSLIKKVEAANQGIYKKTIKTHCRNMIILPSMVGLKILIHRGKEFSPLEIENEMVGHRLGEFAETRIRLKHSAPGIGATKSSAHQSVK